MRVDLYDLSYRELSTLIAELKESSFRTRQLWHWLYQRLATDFSSMTSLPKETRLALAKIARISNLETITIKRSGDGETEKRLSRLQDGKTIESVLMSYEKRHTVCVSTQVGCAMGCHFCATGQMGFERNLSTGEIVAQVISFERDLRKKEQHVTNIVFMGMGEPLHNYAPTVKAIRQLTNADGFNLGARRITVSTVGLPDKIRQLAKEGLPVRLAISLHAVTDKSREKLIPVAKRWKLEAILAAARDYAEMTGRRVTFEWALVENQNDTPATARALGELLSGMLCHVNLIPLNPTSGFLGKASDHNRVSRFQQILSGYGVPASVRLRRGMDIQAGCGQLKQHVSRKN